MIDFATWLRSERLQRDLDIRDLASLSNLSTAQISRIETGKSVVSLNSMIRLTYGLGMDLREVASKLELKVHIPRKKGLELGDGWTVTAQDARALWNYFREDPGRVKDTFIEAYDGVRKTNPDRVEELGPEERTAEIVWRATDASPIELFPLPYPQGLDESHIQRIFLSGGLITLRDLGVYVRCCRQKKGISLRDTASRMSISHQALFRFENGDIDRISFLQVLELGKELEQEGDLLGLAWRAGEYQTGILFSRLAGTLNPADGWDDRVKAYMDTFIAVARWYMVFMPGESKWMDDLHRYLVFYIEPSNLK
jgi:transcriptional regulator with XRE-family HTH domain